MKINCKDLGCPEPVIKTKKALQSLNEGDILEVELNSISSVENVQRFAKNEGFDVKVQSGNDSTSIFISKNFLCKENVCQKNEGFIDTTLFLKDDKIGEGELGSKLCIGFMQSVLEQDKLPKQIVCVNRAVLLTTADENSQIVQIFKSLENKGVKIYSCGVCLEYFGKTDELKVGEIGNAYSTIEMLLKGAVSL